MTPDRAYRLLLWCYPAEFRREYGPEMLLVYRERAQAEPPAALWMALFADLMRTAPKEHVHMIRNDLIYAWRSLRRTPVTAAAIVATLVLAIGANTAIFSVVHAELLAPLPYPRPDRLVRVWETNLKANQPEFSASVPNFVSWREQSRAFSELACWGRGAAILMVNGEPQRVSSASVSGSLFHMLGLRLVLGRGIQADDENPGKPVEIVLSQSAWLSRYGGDPGIVGKSIAMAAGKVTVAGVVRTDPEIFSDVEIFAPLKIDVTRESRGNHTLRALGRLRDGWTIGQADEEMKTLAAGLEKEYPQSNNGWSVRLVPAVEWLVPPKIRSGVGLLMAAAGMVLLIACANVANLILSRTAARSQEMAVRSALGAARGRLVRLLLTESALLALVGGAAGIALAYWGVSAVGTTLPEILPRGGVAVVSRPVLLFSAGVTLLCGLLFGLAPAWRASRLQLADSLRSGGRGSTSASRRTRNALVTAQLALATALAAGAGLFLISLWNLRHAPLGFAPDHLLVARVGLAVQQSPDGRAGWEASRRLLEGVRAIPSVRSAGLTSEAPLTGGNTSQEMEPLGPSALGPGEQFMPAWRIVDPDYFRTMSIPLIAGRTFTEHDNSDTNSLIVSEGYARRLWPGAPSARDAVGKQVRNRRNTVFTIVGVVGDVRQIDLSEDPTPIQYFSAAQVTMWPANVVVRTAGDPLSIVAAIREHVKSIDPRAPVFQVQTMERMIADNSAQARWNTSLIGGFAVLALVLGAVGTYGVLAYAVALRRREIGVRIALGAAAGDVVRMVVREGMTLAAVGIATGVALSLALGRFATTLLFEVKPNDPATLATVAVVLAAVAFAASILPARRAARVDPVTALRAE